MNSLLRNVKTINIPTIKYFSKNVTPSLSTIENIKPTNSHQEIRYNSPRSRSLPPNLNPIRTALEHFRPISVTAKSIAGQDNVKFKQTYRKLLNQPTFKTASKFRKNFGQKTRKPQQDNKQKQKQNVKDVIYDAPCIKPENDALYKKKALLSPGTRNFYSDASSGQLLQKATSLSNFRELYQKSPIKALISLNEEAKNNSKSSNFIGKTSEKNKVKFHYLSENTECKQCISKNKKRFAEFYRKNEDIMNPYSQKKRYFSTYIHNPKLGHSKPKEVVLVKDQNLGSTNQTNALTLFSLIKLQSSKHTGDNFVPTNLYKFEAKKNREAYEFLPEDSTPSDPYPLEMFQEDYIDDIKPAESFQNKSKSCPDFVENDLELVAKQHLMTIKPREKDMFKKLYDMTPCRQNHLDDSPVNKNQKKFNKLKVKCFNNIILDSNKFTVKIYNNSRLDNNRKADNSTLSADSLEPSTSKKYDNKDNQKVKGLEPLVALEHRPDNFKYFKTGLELTKRKIKDEDSGKKRLPCKVPKVKKEKSGSFDKETPNTCIKDDPCNQNKNDKKASEIIEDVKIKPVVEILGANELTKKKIAKDSVKVIKDVTVSQENIKEFPVRRYSIHGLTENVKKAYFDDTVTNKNHSKKLDHGKFLKIFKARSDKYKDLINRINKQQVKAKEPPIEQNPQKDSTFCVNPKDSLNEKIYKANSKTVPKIELGEQSKQIIAVAIKQMLVPIIEKEFLKYEEVKHALERMEKRLSSTLRILRPIQSTAAVVETAKNKPKYSKYPWQKIQINNKAKLPKIVDPLEQALDKKDPVKRNRTIAWRNAMFEEEPRKSKVLFDSNERKEQTDEIINKTKKPDCFVDRNQKLKQQEPEIKIDQNLEKKNLKSVIKNCQKFDAPTLCNKHNDIPVHENNFCSEIKSKMWPLGFSKSDNFAQPMYFTKSVCNENNKNDQTANPDQFIQITPRKEYVEPSSETVQSFKPYQGIKDEVSTKSALENSSKDHITDGMKNVGKSNLNKKEPCSYYTEPPAETFIQLSKSTSNNPTSLLSFGENKNKNIDVNVLNKKLKQEKVTLNTNALEIRSESKQDSKPVHIDVNKMNDKKGSSEMENPLKSCQATDVQTKMEASPTKASPDEKLVENGSNKTSDLCMMIVRKNKSGQKAAPIVVTLTRSQPIIGKFEDSSGVSNAGASGGNNGDGKNPDDIVAFPGLSIFKNAPEANKESVVGWALGSKTKEEKPEHFLNMKDSMDKKCYSEPSIDLKKIANDAQKGGEVLCKSNRNKSDHYQNQKKKDDPCKEKKSTSKTPTITCTDSGNDKSKLDPKIKQLGECIKNLRKKNIIANEKSNQDSCKPPKKKPDHCEEKKKDPCQDKEKKKDPCEHQQKKKDPCEFMKKKDPCATTGQSSSSGSSQDPKIKELNDCVKRIKSKDTIIEDNNKSDHSKKPKEDPCKKDTKDPCKKSDEAFKIKKGCTPISCKNKVDLCKKEDPCKKETKDPCKKEEKDPCKKQDHKSEPCIPCKYEDYSKKCTTKPKTATTETKSEPCIPCKYEDYSKKNYIKGGDSCKKDSAGKKVSLTDCINQTKSKDAVLYQPKTPSSEDPCKKLKIDLCKKEAQDDPCKPKKEDPCKNIKKKDPCKPIKKQDPCKKMEQSTEYMKKKNDVCDRKDDPCKPKKKKEDPCKKQEDPCKKKEDPCKKKEDPCKKKEDPCKKKEDPCKKKEDPCKRKEDPCKKKEDLCKKKDDPCKKKEDPCKKKDDPCKKKEDLCKKKEDPCKKKEDPCKKKEDPCKKKEDPCNKKDDPCKKKEDPCKKKEDPCKKKEDPCKKKEDPCKKKEDPCKKKKDPCEKKDDPCKKKDDKSKKSSGKLIKCNDEAMNKPIKKETLKKQFKEKYPWNLLKKNKECLMTKSSMIDCKAKKSSQKSDIDGIRSQSDPCLSFKENDTCAPRDKILKKFELKMKETGCEDPCKQLRSLSAKDVRVNLFVQERDRHRSPSVDYLKKSLGIIFNKAFLKVKDSRYENNKDFHTSSRVRKTKSANLNGKKNKCEASGSKSTHTCREGNVTDSCQYPHCGCNEIFNSTTKKNTKKTTGDNLFPNRSKVDSTLGIIEFCKQKLGLLEKLEAEYLDQKFSGRKCPKKEYESVKVDKMHIESEVKRVLKCFQSCSEKSSEKDHAVLQSKCTNDCNCETKIPSEHIKSCSSGATDVEGAKKNLQNCLKKRKERDQLNSDLSVYERTFCVANNEISKTQDSEECCHDSKISISKSEQNLPKWCTSKKAVSDSTPLVDCYRKCSKKYNKSRQSEMSQEPKYNFNHLTKLIKKSSRTDYKSEHTESDSKPLIDCSKKYPEKENANSAECQTRINQLESTYLMKNKESYIKSSKSDPILTKKHRNCQKEADFYENIKEGPCENIEETEKFLKKNDDICINLCNKKEDPCKKKENPCKRKEDPCKKKDDPCKKKEDPCKSRQKCEDKKSADSCQFQSSASNYLEMLNKEISEKMEKRAAEYCHACSGKSTKKRIKSIKTTNTKKSKKNSKIKKKLENKCSPKEENRETFIPMNQCPTKVEDTKCVASTKPNDSTGSNSKSISGLLCNKRSKSEKLTSISEAQELDQCHKATTDKDKTTKDYLKLKCDETSISQCNKEVRKTSPDNHQCLKETSMFQKDYLKLNCSSKTSTDLAQGKESTQESNNGNDPCSTSKSSKDYIRRKCDVTTSEVSQKSSKCSSQASNFPTKRFKYTNESKSTDQSKTVCPASVKTNKANSPEDYLKLKCSANNDKTPKSYKHYLKPRTNSKIPQRINDKCSGLKSKTTIETVPFCRPEIKKSASTTDCLMVSKKPDENIRIIQDQLENANTSLENLKLKDGKCSLSLEDTLRHCDKIREALSKPKTTLICNSPGVSNGIEFPKVIAKDYLCSKLTQEDVEEDDHCLDPGIKPKDCSLHKGIKNLTIGYEQTDEVRDMGLLRESMLLVRRKLNPVVTAATEEEIEDLICREDTFIAKVQKLGLGEKLVCSYDKNGKLINDYQEKEFKEEGIERILKCAVAKDKFSKKEKILCAEILPKEDLEQLEKEHIKKAVRGKETTIAKIKIISNKLVCKRKCNGGGFSCKLMTVEEITVPRRTYKSKNKIYKRKALSYNELMKKCREREKMENSKC